METHGATPALGPPSDGCPPMYRPRDPRASPLFQLFETHYETVKSVWEERFERQYGFWQGRWDRAVAAYLDCGLFESGFAIVRCPVCKAEFHVAFSCRCRGLCPSCSAKRAAIFSELLVHRILADVPHAQWVFSIPKMLRPYFLYRRELLGALARLAYETVREMMAAASDEPDARPGMVAVIQTFGSSLKWNPHIHAIVTRGVFLANGQWHPIPYVDTHKAELVFRHKVLTLLRDLDLISEERIDLLLSWKHSGFNIHNHTTVYPNDTEGLHRLACYLHRAPVNLSRLRYHPESGLLIYEPTAGQEVDDNEPIDPLEFLARVLIHIPEPNKHLVHFNGAYANRSRSSMPHGRNSEQNKRQGEGDEEPAPAKRAVRKRWAELIYKIYNVDPLTCQCGAQMKIVAFVTEPDSIRRILAHRNNNSSRQRAPPDPTLNLH